MKLFTIALSIFVLAACGAGKESEPKLSETNPPEIEVDAPEATFYIGIVRLNSDDCEIKIEVDGLETDIYPVGLADMYKVEGAQLEFSMIPSRAPLPKGCESCKAAVLENVVRQKG